MTEVLTEQRKAEIYNVIAQYLLYERREETEIRVAFAALVQERHSHFHDEDTEFTECSNELCITALKLLQSAREPKIEINDFSIQLIAPYSMKIQKSDKTCIAQLEEKAALVSDDGQSLLKV